MPSCGTQIALCDLPIHFDTYRGCTHDCEYCFARKRHNIEKIEFEEGATALRNFINGDRNIECYWCDWNIPLHIGGMSDPFQPIEKKYKRTKECLEVLAETKYPVVISTKGRLCVDPEYLSILKECNVCMQVSAVCSSYDKIERGAPTFEERLQIIKELSANVKRVIVRAQPYMREVFPEVIGNIERFKSAGAYGVVFEGMKFQKKVKGLIKVGADFVYPIDGLKEDFEHLRKECHSNGLKFYSGENRLRSMGDSLTCCGIDGLEGFVPNCFNLSHILNGDIVKPTEKMKEKGTGVAFKATNQAPGYYRRFKEKSYAECMISLYTRNREKQDLIFGVDKK